MFIEARNRLSQPLTLRIIVLVAFLLSFKSACWAQRASDGIFFVSPNGSDSNNGLSWSTAKLTLGGAQTACPASGDCAIHVSAGGITLSSTFTLSRAETTITCEPGAVITTGVPSGSDSIYVTANDTRVTQCTFNASTGTDAIDIPKSVSRVSIDHNLFENYPDGGADTVIFVGNRANSAASEVVTDIAVTDNMFLNNAGDDVDIQDYVSRVVVSKNRIVSTVTNANNPLVNAQTTDSDTVIQGLVVSDNIMSNGMAADCVQIQQLSGNPISDVTVSGNVCTLQESASGGTGYSMAGITVLSSVGNIFDANGQAFGGGNAPFEFVNVQYGTESNNSALLGTQSTAHGYIFTVIGSGGSSLNDTFSGNSASVAYTGTGTFGCWFAGSSTAGSTVSRNSFTGNTCDLTGSTGKVAGFFMQASNSSATVNNNFVSENNFIGTDVTGDAGICVEHDSGTMAHIVIGPNNLYNFHLSYCQNWGAQSAGLPSSVIDPLTYGSSLSGPN